MIVEKRGIFNLSPTEVICIEMKYANHQQMVLIDGDPVFPSTRFQDSKLKIVDWILGMIKELKFHTVLDAFGGTGCVGYMLKVRGKSEEVLLIGR